FNEKVRIHHSTVNNVFLSGSSTQEFHDFSFVGSILQLPVYTGKQHLDGGTHDFQVAEFFCSDIHQQVVLVGIRFLRAERLHEVLHCGLEFPVGSAELLQQQRSKSWVRCGDSCIELKILDVIKHSVAIFILSAQVLCPYTLLLADLLLMPMYPEFMKTVERVHSSGGWR